MEKQTVNFGTAIEALKQGLRVAREGWNGKGMFLFLVPGSTFQVNRPPLLGIYPEGTTINYLSHIDMKTADEKVVPWLASQTDVLAEDWIVLDEGFVSQHEKDMVSFGEYLLSDERRKSFEAAYNSEDNLSLEERLAGIYHVDFENWKAKQ